MKDVNKLLTKTMQKREYMELSVLSVPLFCKPERIPTINIKTEKLNCTQNLVYKKDSTPNY